MSSDNYGVVHRFEDGWGVSMFFASDDEEAQLDFSDPMYETETLTDAMQWAENEWFEYGWSVDEHVGFRDGEHFWTD